MDCGVETLASNYLPDGNYLYTLVITDSKSKVRTIGPFSGIILDRNEPDFPETTIVSAIDGEGKAIYKFWWNHKRIQYYVHV